MRLTVVARISVRSCAYSFPQRGHRLRKNVLRVTLNRLGLFGINGLLLGKKTTARNVG